ncbi:HvfB family MNIO-type RiPP peptide maturase [Chitinophaga sp. W2I13]|uniref:HvfB family MNIO-type RiPP peptide maturase n=1 Tax=Chitinophaga sp. W2I13 TaxID=3373923 RepID=UPI003D1A3908
MVGIGFRREFAEEMISGEHIRPDFIEFAPENWMNIGGYWKKVLHRVVEKYPVLCHGLSLSIGSPEALDKSFLRYIKAFLREYNVQIYSEHLSYSKCDNAHMYDLLPIPFRMDAVKHIASRIQQVQDYLQRPLVMEIVSYYTPVAAEMSEVDFINEVVKQSGCQLLLDVNNIYVNAFNHQYDAKAFIQQLPLSKVAYIHMAGHEQVAPDLIIDTHGEPIIDPVYDLFEWTIQHLQPVPVLLERDFNIPEMAELQGELTRLKNICHKQWTRKDELVA